MSATIPFKRRPHVAPRRPLPRLAVRIHVHVDGGSRPVGRSRSFELDERGLAELLAAASRMEARQ
jgi:hypothetical protein